MDTYGYMLIITCEIATDGAGNRLPRQGVCKPKQTKGITTDIQFVLSSSGKLISTFVESCIRLR